MAGTYSDSPSSKCSLCRESDPLGGVDTRSRTAVDLFRMGPYSQTKKFKTKTAIQKITQTKVSPSFSK